MGWKDATPRKSYACNAELLGQLRERRGWTQATLAERSGYSLRLVSKAESGQPISAAAVVDLAQALGATGDPVFPEDLICNPVELAKEYNNAIHTRGKDAVDHVAHFLDENIVFRMLGNPDQIPFAGEHRGIDAMRRALQVFFSILEAPANHDHTEWYRYIGQGNEVTMWGESWIHPIGQPLKKPISTCNRFVFQRGKIVLIEDIFDTQAGKEALDNARLGVSPETA